MGDNNLNDNLNNNTNNNSSDKDTLSIVLATISIVINIFSLSFGMISLLAGMALAIISKVTSNSPTSRKLSKIAIIIGIVMCIIFFILIVFMATRFFNSLGTYSDGLITSW